MLVYEFSFNLLKLFHNEYLQDKNFEKVKTFFYAHKYEGSSWANLETTTLNRKRKQKTNFVTDK